MRLVADEQSGEGGTGGGEADPNPIRSHDENLLLANTRTDTPVHANKRVNSGEALALINSQHASGGGRRERSKTETRGPNPAISAQRSVLPSCEQESLSRGQGGARTSIPNHGSISGPWSPRRGSATSGRAREGVGGKAPRATRKIQLCGASRRCSLPSVCARVVCVTISLCERVRVCVC